MELDVPAWLRLGQETSVDVSFSLIDALSSAHLDKAKTSYHSAKPPLTTYVIIIMNFWYNFVAWEENLLQNLGLKFSFRVKLHCMMVRQGWSRIGRGHQHRGYNYRYME